MRLLLDTHAFLWFCEDDPQLSQTASAAIHSMENTVFVSAGSLWEIAIKTSLGKLTLKRPFASLKGSVLTIVNGSRPDCIQGAQVVFRI